MLNPRFALMGLGLLVAVAPTPAAAQNVTVRIEQINTVVFPADGSSAAADICAGLEAGVLSRDQVGTSLAQLQAALNRYADGGYVKAYVSAFNSAAAGVPGCNVQVTGPANSNLNRWSY